MKGYNLSFNNSVIENKKSNNKEDLLANYSASIDNGLSVLTVKKTNAFENNFHPEPMGDSCDVIKLRNNKIIKAKVTVVNLNDIEFRLCDDRGIGKVNRIISKEKVASITYSNGFTDVIKSAIENSGGVCLDTIYRGTKKSYGIIHEIGIKEIVYEALLFSGQLEYTRISKAGIAKIGFCNGHTLIKTDLNRVTVNVVDRNKMIDPLFWEKSKYDVIVAKDPEKNDKIKINGFITHLSADTIKFIPFETTDTREVAINTNNVKEIRLYNQEIFTRYELIKLQNKISSRSKVGEYAKSIERKERVVKSLTSRAIKMSVLGLLLPVIGIVFAFKADYISKQALRITNENPELKKYRKKAICAKALGIFSVILSFANIGISVIFGLLGIWWLLY